MSYLFIFWILLLPFITFAGSFEGPKVVWFWVGGFLLSVFWIFRLLRKVPIQIKVSDSVLLIWIVILLVSSVLGIHSLESILGGSYRHQGVVFFLTLFLISITLPILPKKMHALLFNMAVIGLIAQSVLVYIQKFGLSHLRPIGTFGEPNAVAGFLAVGLYFVLSNTSYSFVRRGLIGLCICSAVLMTASRTGMITAGVVVLGAVIPPIIRFRKNAVVLGAILGLMASFGMSVYSYARVISITRPISTFENRGEFWRVGIQEFSKRPILGYGAESLEVVYDRAYKRISFPLSDFMIDRSHNIFLDVALWSGGIGLAVFIVWLFSILRVGDLPKRIAVISWLLFACFQPVGVVQWVLLILISTPFVNTSPDTAKTGREQK